MPGNLAELRPLIFIASFIGLTVLMVGWMVTESPILFIGADPGGSSTGEGSTSPMSLLAWNETYVLNLTNNMPPPFQFEIGNWKMIVQKYVPPTGPGLSVETYESWWVFTWNFDPFRWYKDGNEVSVPGHTLAYGDMFFIEPSRLDSDFTNEGTSGLKYTIKNTRTQMDVSFAFNTTLYDNPSDAYSANDIGLIFDIDWNERNTSVNAISFISGLFTFSLPGVPIYVSVILWVMMFPPLAYLTFIFVIKVLGAVFGGG